ncbi:MAG: hypothetical protein ACK55I_00880, partial [bacterium]
PQLCAARLVPEGDGVDRHAPSARVHAADVLHRLARDLAVGEEEHDVRADVEREHAPERGHRFGASRGTHRPQPGAQPLHGARAHALPPVAEDERLGTVVE